MHLSCANVKRTLRRSPLFLSISLSLCVVSSINHVCTQPVEPFANPLCTPAFPHTTHGADKHPTKWTLQVISVIPPTTRQGDYSDDEYAELKPGREWLGHERTSTNAHAREKTHTSMHTYAFTHTHIRTHTNTHMHIYTYTQWYSTNTSLRNDVTSMPEQRRVDCCLILLLRLWGYISCNKAHHVINYRSFSICLFICYDLAQQLL